MMYFVSWLVFTTLCFFFLFCNGADLNGRMRNHWNVVGFWKFHQVYFSEGFFLMVHDYMRVHCPWSWSRAKQHRLAHMREYLGEMGRSHKDLGHITSADCDDPTRQESIARGAFISRLRFWSGGVARFFTAWLTLPLLFALALIVGILEILMYAWECMFG